MLYLDGRQELSEFVLRCLKLSGSDEKYPTNCWRNKNIFGKIFVMFLQVIT